MKRTPSIVALVLVVIASVAPAAQDETGSRTHASTIWTASSLEAARLARVEAQVAAGIKGDDPIELTVRQWMETFNIPGLSVAVFDRHELVWAKTYGVTQPGGSEPVTLDTIFQAGSISKPVTAMAALHFVEAGNWTLDRNINDTLISWKVPDSAFTKTRKSRSAGCSVTPPERRSTGFPATRSASRCRR